MKKEPRKMERRKAKIIFRPWNERMYISTQNFKLWNVVSKN